MYIQPLPPLGFCDAVKICFKKYCTFTGRARRSEYWSLVLFSFLVSIIPGIFLFFSLIFTVTQTVVNFTQNMPNSYSRNNNKYNMEEIVEKSTSSFTPLILFFTMIIVIINILLAIPIISAGVRRLHDTGRSGLFILLFFIPFGNIILLIFFIEDSQQAPNMYGPSPKYLSNQNGSLMSNQAIQLADMSNMSNINPQPQFIQAYPQRNIYENMYQQNPQYVQYPQYPLNMQQIPYQQNLAQKPYPLVEQVDPNSQAGIIMPVVYP